MSVAIVTGASSGLGHEYVLALMKQHPDIEEYWLIARREERLNALKAQMPGKRVKVLPLDLTDKACMSALQAALDEEKPDVKYLINNSGYGKLGDFYGMPVAFTGGMVELNCVALTAVTSMVLPFMGKGSSVIMVCSIAAFVPTPRMAVYCSTKAYVLSLSKALHYELKPRGINVLACCPAPMSTEFLSVANIDNHSRTFNMLPRVSPSKMAERSIAACDKGRCVYTLGALYKVYRVLGKVLPHNWLEPLTKC